MIKLKTNKGITLITLVTTVVILLILAGAIVSKTSSSISQNSYNNLVADIKKLRDEVTIYYSRYNDIPKTDRANGSININEKEYFEIDFTKLNGVSLNFGKENGQNANLAENPDVYVIDSNLNIYYLKGVLVDETEYHNID